MSVEEVCLNGVQIEPSTRFVHKRRQTCRRIVSATLADPLDGLFQADFQLDVHPESSSGRWALTGRHDFVRKSIVGPYLPDKITGTDQITGTNLQAFPGLASDVTLTCVQWRWRAN